MSRAAPNLGYEKCPTCKKRTVYIRVREAISPTVALERLACRNRACLFTGLRIVQPVVPPDEGR